MKRVIINADDFGLSGGVNRGIVEAFEQGLLTSTTMLVNLTGFDDAVRLARAHTQLPVGVHLSLLWGPPLSPAAEVDTLVEADGLFPGSLAVLARRYFLGKLDLAQVRVELSRQLRRFVESGLTPTHVDTHKHVHCLPRILETVADVAKEHGVTSMRLPIERRLGRWPTTWPGRVKRRLIAALARGGRNQLHRRGIKTTDHFVGIGDQDRLNSETLGRILQNVRSGVTEIMCHPGYLDREAQRYSKVPPHREQELRALTDPQVRSLALDLGIDLVSYREL